MATRNFAISSVATPPSPATSGGTLVASSGTGGRFYLGQATIYPFGSTPTPANAEVVTITNITGDTLTITRGQEGSTPRAIVATDVISQGITSSMWDTLWNAVFPPALSYVRITTTGATFNPTVELVGGSGATVTWVSEEGGVTATGLNPTLSFGSAGTRHVRMTVANGAVDAMADVRTFNLGYNHTDDAGDYVMGAQYDKTAQAVTLVENVQVMTGLVRFAAANIATLGGNLNFTGLSNLQYVECCYSRVQSATLTGCTSLIRLALEQNNLTSPLDLNPVAGNLRDLRAAAQQSGALTLSTLSSPLAQLYHLCVRDQTVTGMPTAAQLPVVRELWIWNTGQSGTLTSSSSAIASLLANGNAYTSVVLTGRTTMAFANLQGNALPQAAVDAVLVEAASWGTSNRAIDVSGGSNAAPSATGTAARATLLGRGWTVTVNSGVLWSDDFQRADASGIAAVGNGWFAAASAPTADIVSGDLVRTDNGAYRVLGNPAGGALPADYTVTATFAGAALSGGYLGIVGRWAAAEGVQAFFNNNTNTYSELYLCLAHGYLSSPVALTQDAALPGSWTTPGSSDHTFAMQFVGTTVNIILDGVQVAHGTIATNNTTGTAIGWSGEGQNRHLRSIVVT